MRHERPSPDPPGHEEGDGGLFRRGVSRAGEGVSFIILPFSFSNPNPAKRFGFEEEKPVRRNKHSRLRGCAASFLSFFLNHGPSAAVRG